ncbi:MAG: hypothetical protein II156_03755, partial [Lachnospiraceae bacterium]|nr:hypothetical protein [Lachnospiraceae bacterium]
MKNPDDIQVVVMMGGLGTRLGEITATCPKPLLPVFGMVVNASVVRILSVEYIGLTGTFNAVFQVLNLAELG